MEILPNEYWEMSERICRDETGYPPDELLGSKGACDMLIHGYLESEFQHSGKYPSSIDSFVGANPATCFPLRVEREIRFSIEPNGTGYQLDGFSKVLLDSLSRIKDDQKAFSEETREKYFACMRREGQIRWQEYHRDTPPQKKWWARFSGRP